MFSDQIHDERHDHHHHDHLVGTMITSVVAGLILAAAFWGLVAWVASRY